MKWFVLSIQRDQLFVYFFGFTIWARDLFKFPPMFSERNGYVRFYDLVWKKAHVRVTFRRRSSPTDFLFRSRP